MPDTLTELIEIIIFLGIGCYTIAQIRSFINTKVGAILDHYYPVFSHDEILHYEKLHKEHEKEARNLTKQSSRLGDGEEMQGIFPSKNYLRLFEDQGRAFGLSATYLKRYQLMREANYEVFNGKTIEEAKKKYDKEITKFCGALPGRGQLGKEYEGFYKKLGDLYVKYGNRSETRQEESALEMEVFKSRHEG